MYTDMVIIVVYSATCTSYVLTQAKHAMVLYGRVNLGLYREKKINTAMHFVKESLHSLFSCFHGYIIYGSTLVYNALVLNVHLEHITQSVCISIRNMINNWNGSIPMSNDWLTFSHRPWPQSRSNIILCANKIALRTLTLIVIYFFRAIEKKAN